MILQKYKNIGPKLLFRYHLGRSLSDDCFLNIYGNDVKGEANKFFAIHWEGIKKRNNIYSITIFKQDEWARFYKDISLSQAYIMKRYLHDI